MNEEHHLAYMAEMQKTITETIERVVNGKIKTMDEKLSLFTLETRNWRDKEFAQYVKDDLNWKEVATPVIKAGNSLYSVGRLAVYFFGGLATIAGGITVVKLSLISLLK